jgi:hypothetical protein
MSSSTFRQIESGPTFEIHEGPTCLLRLDWGPSTIRATYVGHVMAACAQPLIRRSELMMRAGQGPCTSFQDAWLVTGYESGMRVNMVEWAKKNPTATKELHILSQSKIMNMAVAVMNLALGGVVKGYSKRQDFDVMAKRMGLPLNPPMPAFSPSPSAGIAR